MNNSLENMMRQPVKEKQIFINSNEESTLNTEYLNNITGRYNNLMQIPGFPMEKSDLIGKKIDQLGYIYNKMKQINDNSTFVAKAA